MADTIVSRLRQPLVIIQRIFILSFVRLRDRAFWRFAVHDLISKRYFEEETYPTYLKIMFMFYDLFGILCLNSVSPGITSYELHLEPTYILHFVLFATFRENFDS